MGDTVHNKLVRDNIPNIIRANNAVPITRILGSEARRKALFEKLIEEAQEVLDSDGSLDEFADVKQVFDEAIEAAGFSPEQVEQARSEKEAARGGFRDGIFLEKTIEP